MFDKIRNLYNIEQAYVTIKQIEKDSKNLKLWFRLIVQLSKIKEVQDMLSGYKTYLMAGGVAALAVLHFFKLIDDTTFNTLMSIFAGGGIAALRSAVSKLE